jgi:hypothetical protein
MVNDLQTPLHGLQGDTFYQNHLHVPARIQTLHKLRGIHELGRQLLPMLFPETTNKAKGQAIEGPTKGNGGKDQMKTCSYDV